MMSDVLNGKIMARMVELEAENVQLRDALHMVADDFDGKVYGINRSPSQRIAKNALKEADNDQDS